MVNEIVPVDAGSGNEDGDVRLIAFYLPQFHPIPENDHAWGRGFTEWTNVSSARPLFDGHYQPQLPGELGFYDLRVPEVLCQQAELAQSYGIYGFCYYYYWFDGRRLLERPLETMLASGRPDMPFCVCWANENWSRRWDGSDQEIIVAQTFSEEMRPRIIEDLIPCFTDPRYIAIDNRPLFLVYRPDIIPDLRNTLTLWRETARRHGIELHIAACLTFGFSDPLSYGFDSGVEFPPHGVIAGEVNDRIDWSGKFEGKAFAYQDVVESEIAKAEPPYPLFRGIMPGWDNTPRRGNRGHIFIGAEPARFAAWLAALVMRCRRLAPPGQRLIFINAWNEWAEGAHIEPDRQFGRQWLAACARAVRGTAALGDEPWQAVFDDLQSRANPRDNPDLCLAVDLLRQCRKRIAALEAASSALSVFYFRWLDSDPFRAASPALPMDRLRQGLRLRSLRARQAIDRPPPAPCIEFTRQRPQFLSGWLCPIEQPEESWRDARLAVMLTAEGEGAECYIAFGRYGVERADIIGNNPDLPTALAERAGVDIHFDLREVLPGRYTMLLGIRRDSDVMLAPEPTKVLIL
jgi:hypothetical protein